MARPDNRTDRPQERERHAADRRGRSQGANNRGRALKIDTLVDLRHTLSELHAAVSEIEAVDFDQAQFRVTDAMGSPLSRVALGRRRMAVLLNRYRSQDEQIVDDEHDE